MKCHTVTNYSYPGIKLNNICIFHGWTNCHNPWDVVSGFKHDNRLKCHRGIVSQWTFQVGLNVAVDETWVDVTSRHPANYQALESTRFVLDS
jgi:hypothetical protein